MVAYKEIGATANGHLSHPKYRPDIDGLRAIAVLSVVVYHAFPSLLTGGFVGVDIFFVISGFLISTIIFGSLDKSSFSLTEFYARRVKRIFPALIVVLVACLVFGWFALFPDEYMQLGKHVIGGAGFVSNIMLWSESGYFDTAADTKPLLHLWSLGIEEQFYIVWPAIAWAIWKIRLNALTFTLVILFASFALNVGNIHTDGTGVFFLPQTRIWELLAGTVLAYVSLYWRQQRALLLVDKLLSPMIFSDSRPADGSTIKNLMSFAGVLIIAASVYMMTSALSFPGWWAVFPCTGAFLIIYAGPSAWLNRQVLASKPFVWVGLISFPLYLWHWPLLSFARIIEGQVPSPEIRAGAMVLSIVLAWLTYRLIETPLKRRDHKLKTAALVMAMAAIAGAGYYIYSQAGIAGRPAVKASERFNSQFVSSNWKYSTNETCLTKYPLAGSEDYAWRFCMASKEAPPTVVLMGNSFANHLYPAFANTDGLKGNSVLSFGACAVDISSADIAVLSKLAPTSPCAGSRPKDQQDHLRNIITASGTVRYAIIGGLHSVQTSEAIASVEEAIAFVKSKGVKPIVFVPHVSAYHDLKGCFTRPFKLSATSDCQVDVSVRETINAGFAPLIESLAKSNPDVPVFDPNDLYCTSDKCSLVIDGMPVFRDKDSHYSEYASEKLGKMFAEWAKTHAPGILSQ
ncbi:acyltransferase family protein [Pseudomonas sp. B16120]|uniref:acyltransferase family protein n=1 Tax=Pseudomonas sp. B16120 TaxID=3235108 RepID=UPI00378437BE